MPRIEYRKEGQRGLLIIFPTLSEQRPPLRRKRPVEETNTIGLKKIGPYKLITTEKRSRTPDILATENKDIRLKTIVS